MTEAYDPASLKDTSARASAVVFELFVLVLARSIMGSKQQVEEYESLSPDVGVGFDATIFDEEGTPWLIAARLDNPSTPERLRAVTEALSAAATKLSRSATASPHLILAIPGVLAEERVEPLTKAGITLWDGPRLADIAAAEGIDVPPGLGVRRFIRRGSTEADGYRRRLARIATGKDGWSAFQEWCGDVLDYLLSPPLETPIPELATKNRHNRRDFILPNYAESGFWQFMRVQYSAEYVVIDAKNHSGRLPKKEVLQMANYLSRHGTGLFGMIICRRGFDQGAQWTAQEHWMVHSKLIIALTVNDVLQMLAAKEVGNDPTAVIKQRIEDFRLGL
ncbi:hypothetical protein ACFWQC_03025 [Nocardioides sp. NPDC058538]|uniref:hypothetical protein n=1 Tax=Nocardioides sp. NPDC058538 TaxID=3346542 RepID=UPI0036688EA0